MKIKYWYPANAPKNHPMLPHTGDAREGMRKKVSKRLVVPLGVIGHLADGNKLLCETHKGTAVKKAGCERETYRINFLPAIEICADCKREYRLLPTNENRKLSDWVNGKAKVV